VTSSSIKHIQLRDRVMDLVESLPVGAAIPSERELCVRYGVSRMTLRRALEELARQSYLVRRQGAATCTARPKISQRMTILSFTEDMRRRGMAASSRLISYDLHPAGARLATRLHVSVTDPVLTIGRLRIAGAEPMAIEWLNVPSALVPDLDPRDLESQSFYALISSRFGICIAGGAQTIEPTVTEAHDARLLGVPLHSPALFVERSTWTEAGRVIEFVQSTYRGDRYRFEVELTPSAHAPKP
jgi:GntR family transcriptional regulator